MNKEKQRKIVTCPESVDILWVTKFSWVLLRCGEFSRSCPVCGVAVLLGLCWVDSYCEVWLCRGVYSGLILV